MVIYHSFSERTLTMNHYRINNPTIFKRGESKATMQLYMYV